MTDPPDTPPQPMRICTPEEQQELLQLREREQNLAAARSRIGELEAERDEAMNLLGAASASNATLEQAVRELEAERDRQAGHIAVLETVLERERLRNATAPQEP